MKKLSRITKNVRTKVDNPGKQDIVDKSRVMAVKHHEKTNWIE